MKRASRQQKILSIDPWLQNYASDIRLRMERHAKTRQILLGDYADLSSFANGYLYYGIHRSSDGWVYREWAPGADEIHLIGDFNGWNRTSHPLNRIGEGGNWEIRLKGKDALRHGQRIKIQITRNGERFDRIPLYIHRVLQNSDGSFDGQIWSPEQPFEWTDGGYGKRKIAPLFIYEAHIGMAQEEGKIGTYNEFTDNVLPRIHKDGYNAVQLMAIMEHPYYASFGYQVSNFFAPSSRFGTPDELKRLVNRAHELGMMVFLDLVHSHACANTNEGIACFDGTDDQFFHKGERGWHSAWGTKVFNYGKHEVIHFLLSNIKYWQEEFHFDGFRFDGVTSMLYLNHGLGESFVGGYGKYFSLNTDVEAVTYLQLATELIHAVNPFAVAIAEDMSGMPGMCLPIRYGGIGFDYRLGMGAPDYWIRMIKSGAPENWNLFEMWSELTTRRPQEKVIGYCESHDQALVGDKTIIFRLADAEMYTGMEKSYHSPAIDRAVSLHKLIRFITLALSCEGYLNFMGNEFGHPEWIDFPREGNGDSYAYARRQWSLADHPQLKYEQLLAFDVAMLKFARKHHLMNALDAENLWIEPEYAIMAFSKGGLVYVFNFHSQRGSEAFFLPVRTLGEGRYRVVFSSDRPEFAGFGNVDEKKEYVTENNPERGIGFRLFVPGLTAIVLEKYREP